MLRSCNSLQSTELNAFDELLLLLLFVLFSLWFLRTLLSFVLQCASVCWNNSLMGKKQSFLNKNLFFFLFRKDFLQNETRWDWVTESAEAIKPNTNSIKSVFSSIVILNKQNQHSCTHAHTYILHSLDLSDILLVFIILLSLFRSDSSQPITITDNKTKIIIQTNTLNGG